MTVRVNRSPVFPQLKWGDAAGRPSRKSLKMSTAVTLRTELRDLYLSESARLQGEFTASGDGTAVIERRTELVERILLRLWEEILCPGGDPSNFALVALGGFGRR